ncbi:MAG TPA: DMT family transporter [Bacillota bacterium]
MNLAQDSRSVLHRSNFQGPLLAFLAACGFSTEAVLMKIGYGLGLTALTAVTLRFAVAGLAVLPLVGPFLVRGGRVDRSQGTAIAFATAGNVATTFLLALALRLVSASVGIICFFTFPTMVGLLAHPFLGERLTPKKAVSFALSLVGVALVVWSPGTRVNLLGPLMALGAAAANAASIIVVKKRLGAIPGPVSSSLVVIGTAVVFGGVGAVSGVGLSGVTPGAWATIAGLGLFTTAFALTAFYGSLRMITASQASIIGAFEPFITAVLAVLVLGERLTAWQVLGGCLIVAAVAASPEEPAREPSKH